jgi:hypothetical protein
MKMAMTSTKLSLRAQRSEARQSDAAFEPACRVALLCATTPPIGAAPPFTQRIAAGMRARLPNDTVFGCAPNQWHTSRPAFAQASYLSPGPHSPRLE